MAHQIDLTLNYWNEPAHFMPSSSYAGVLVSSDTFAQVTSSCLQLDVYPFHLHHKLIVSASGQGFTASESNFLLLVPRNYGLMLCFLGLLRSYWDLVASASAHDALLLMVVLELKDHWHQHLRLMPQIFSSNCIRQRTWCHWRPD